MSGKIQSFEDMDVYRLAEDLGGQVWEVVSSWLHFPQNSLGYQLVKSACSIGANTYSAHPQISTGKIVQVFISITARELFG